MGGSLSRDGVSIKTLAGKHSFEYSEISNQGIKNNGVNRAGTPSCESVGPSMYGAPEPASAGRHQATDQTKEKMK